MRFNSSIASRIIASAAGGAVFASILGASGIVFLVAGASVGGILASISVLETKKK